MGLGVVVPWSTYSSRALAQMSADKAGKRKRIHRRYPFRSLSELATCL